MRRAVVREACGLCAVLRSFNRLIEINWLRRDSRLYFSWNQLKAELPSRFSHVFSNAFK
jgi:hypothetical protein